MANCERCWFDAYIEMICRGGTQEWHYRNLIQGRNCTAEEQAGEDAKVCPVCNTKTIHQCTGECMRDGCNYAASEEEADDEL